MKDLLALTQWITILPQVIGAGSKAIADVRAALASNGIDADMSALEFVIADAARQQALAEQEARG